jgi:hypothetical protein
MFKVEHTDTYGGESNYAWVRRYELDLPWDVPQRTLMRRVKALTGLTGIRCKVVNYGDCTAIYPSGICHVVFVNLEE